MPPWLVRLFTLLSLAATFAALLHWVGGSPWTMSLLYGSLFTGIGIVVTSLAAMQRRG